MLDLILKPVSSRQHMRGCSIQTQRYVSHLASCSPFCLQFISLWIGWENCVPPRNHHFAQYVFMILVLSVWFTQAPNFAKDYQKDYHFLGGMLGKVGRKQLEWTFAVFITWTYFVLFHFFFFSPFSLTFMAFLFVLILHKWLKPTVRRTDTYVTYTKLTNLQEPK